MGREPVVLTPDCTPLTPARDRVRLAPSREVQFWTTSVCRALPDTWEVPDRATTPCDHRIVSDPFDLITNDEVVLPGAVVELALKRTLDAFEPRTQPVERVKAFYSTDRRSGYAGSMFTRLKTDPWQVEAGDLWATSLLSVQVPAQYGQRLLFDETVRERTTELLRALDPDLELGKLDADEAAVEIPRAIELYQHFRDQRRHGSRIWVMPAKLAARKRPQLLPVRDNLVFLYLEGFPKPHKRTKLRQVQADIWLMWYLLRNREVDALLTEVIETAGADKNVVELDKSRLRILDTVLWTHAKTVGRTSGS